MTRRLPDRVVERAHQLHVKGGLSIRELGRQMYARFGYASPASCEAALRAAFDRLGLDRRPRAEAQRQAATRHGRAAKGQDRAAYKRWLRAQQRQQQAPGAPRAASPPVPPAAPQRAARRTARAEVAA